MTSMKTLGLAIGIAFAASSFALAQQGSPANNPAAQQANPANSAASGTQPAGSRTSPKTGSAANRQHHRRLYAFQPSAGCRYIRVGNNLFRRTCR
jgi:hypothetical protein